MSAHDIDDLRFRLIARLATETGEDLSPESSFDEVKWVLAAYGFGEDIETPEGTVALRHLFPGSAEGQ